MVSHFPGSQIQLLIDIWFFNMLTFFCEKITHKQIQLIPHTQTATAHVYATLLVCFRN